MEKLWSECTAKEIIEDIRAIVQIPPNVVKNEARFMIPRWYPKATTRTKRRKGRTRKMNIPRVGLVRNYFGE